MKKREIQPRDSDGQFHGYQEWYHGGKLYLRGIMKHGLEINYEEWHKFNETNFYIR